MNFIRYYGKAVFDPNKALSERALEMLPFLKNIYNDQTGYHLSMFYIDDATAEFRNMMGVEEAIEFSYQSE